MKTSTLALLLAILCGGFIAGTIDIGSASVINWLSPDTILHAIATGVLGKSSFKDGTPAAILGLFLQWGMSLIIAAVYVTASRWLRPLKRSWVIGGFAYGVVIFFIMNYVVVPLSAAPWNPWIQHFSVAKFVANLLAMILFGLIVAFCTRSFTPKEPTSNTGNAQDAPA